MLHAMNPIATGVPLMPVHQSKLKLELEGRQYDRVHGYIYIYIYGSSRDASLQVDEDYNDMSIGQFALLPLTLLPT